MLVVAKSTEDNTIIIHNTTTLVLTKDETAELKEKLIALISTRKTRTMLNDTMLAKIKELYLGKADERTLSVASIAQIVGLSKSTVYGCIAAMGIANRNPGRIEHARAMGKRRLRSVP